MATSICWTSKLNAESLVNVGMDALAMLIDHIICFIDLKQSSATATLSYYRAPNAAEGGAGISLLCGHNRFPMFAFAEAPLRPTIYVMKYPEMIQFAVFETSTVLTYRDLRFSEHDYLVALGGYPDYALCVWNFRTRQLLTEMQTHKKCDRNSLRCSGNNLPQIVQVSKWQMKLIVWELCFSVDQCDLHDVTTVTLSNEDHSQSMENAFVYGDDGNLYVVNDFGELFCVEISQNLLKPVWSPHAGWKRLRRLAAQTYSLYAHKLGFIVVRQDAACMLRRRTTGWGMEWCIDGGVLPDIVRFRTNWNLDIYAADHLGGLYRVETTSTALTPTPLAVATTPTTPAGAAAPSTATTPTPTGPAVMEQARLVPLTVGSGSGVQRAVVLDFAPLRGIKEEAYLILTGAGASGGGGEVRAVEALRGILFATQSVPEAIALVVHNAMPYAAIATNNNFIHFVSYEKVRAPVRKATIDLAAVECGHVLALHWLDNTLLAEDELHGRLHYMDANAGEEVFGIVGTMPGWGSDRVSQRIFYAEAAWATLIKPVDSGDSCSLSASVELWTCEALRAERQVARTQYMLPHSYRSVTMPPVVAPVVGTTATISHRDIVDVYGVRDCTSTMDVYQLNTTVKQLTLLFSVLTSHCSHVTGLWSSNRSVLTWALDGVVYHFRNHRKSSQSFGISRRLKSNYAPEHFVLHVEECYNAKYLALLDTRGCFKCIKLPPLNDNFHENPVEFPEPNPPLVIEAYAAPVLLQWEEHKQAEVVPLTPEELAARASLDAELLSMEKEVRQLIEYDMKVTGRSKGIFSKFCLNVKWRRMLNEEARRLFDTERKWLMDCIADQERIRKWILKTISETTAHYSISLRAIFSASTYLQNYAVRKKLTNYDRMYDVYRFYDMRGTGEDGDEEEDDDEEAPDAGDDTDNDEEDGGGGGGKTVAVKAKKARRRFSVHGNVFDHVMAEEFFVQAKESVTANQLYNEHIRFRMNLQDSLKTEFNKIFAGVRQGKQETIDQIHTFNATLTRIYDNMNCMLRLLLLDQFKPPALSSAHWDNDEVIERILTVDDSEIKAINRRKQKKIIEAAKGGRMLLWAVEFWSGALNTMMDGVLEKLWEEEIKKTPAPPEFTLKKSEHEFTLEEIKLFREYQEKLRLLELDRYKYLRILNENEQKTQTQKTAQIIKFNQSCAETAIVKLKYDFAIKHARLRMLTSKVKQIQRIRWIARILEVREDLCRIQENSIKYGSLSEFWEKSTTDIRQKLEMLQMRDKGIEKDFKGRFLNAVPGHMTSELTKLFKRRPKIAPKTFNSSLVCLEVGSRVAQKTTRIPFPLPKEALEYIKAVEALDDAKNSPNQLETKHWDNFTRLRRQKIENELKLKASGFQMLDAQSGMNSFLKDIGVLKIAKANGMALLDEIAEKYFDSVQDQAIQVTLTLGQVEIELGGSLHTVRNTVLMNIDDVNDVNAMIKKAGAFKLRAMQRVAFFRRQVIYKEWEHQVTRANVDYLKYMINVVEKCKVTMEFLEILRNWPRVQQNRDKSTLGLIERVVEQKVKAAYRNLNRIIEIIDLTRLQIDQMRRKHHQLNREIDRVKVGVTMASVQRDVLAEERRSREAQGRMAKIVAHRSLMETVRGDFLHMMELSTILELQRLRTYPTLGPAPSHCI